MTHRQTIAEIEARHEKTLTLEWYRGELARVGDRMERAEKQLKPLEATNQELMRRLDRAYEALVGASLGHEAMIAMLRANAQRQGGG